MMMNQLLCNTLHLRGGLQNMGQSQTENFNKIR